MVYISLQCIKLTDINFELILKQMIRTWCDFYVSLYNQSRINGLINTHLTIAHVMSRNNHNNEKQEAL